MHMNHAVVRIDHHSAEIFEFDSEQVVSRRVNEQLHATRQHGSEVRSQHEFFAAVCDSVQGIGSLLIAAHHTAQADFRHYVEKHRPEVAARIAGWETVDQETDHQLVAMARRYFPLHARMAEPMKPV